MAELCDLCGSRPATVRARVTRNGETEDLDLCEVDYRRLAARQRSFSPMESLFGGRGSLFDDMFGSEMFGTDLFGGRGFGPAAAGGDGSGRQIPVGRGGGGSGGRGAGRGGPGGAPAGGDGARARAGAGDGARRAAPRRTSDVEDRLSEHAMELLQIAARRAAELGRREVDTEHLMMALLESDVVRTVLQQFGVQPDELRQHLEQEAPRGDAGEEEITEIGVTPRVKSALNRAFAASHELGHSYVGPEHFLIGLAEEGEGIGGDVLRRLGLTPQALRQQVVKVVGRGAEAGQVDRPTNTPNLDKYARDLTALAREGKLDPVIGRNAEIETTIEVLARRRKNNPVLIGEPGVGKTAIVEGLAQRVVSGDVPEALRNKRLVELSINSMVAGSKYRGEFEERAQQVLKEVAEHKDELILFIDELHTIVGAGASGGEGGLDVANVFKPALSRGELNLIGATTLNEYQKHIEKDAALERRFQPVFVSEPTTAQAIMILRGLRDTLEAHHKVVITDEAIIAAVELSERYITGRYLPDKAIDLIDQAAARVKISSSARPVEVQDLESDARTLKRELDYATNRKQTDRAQDLKAQHEAKTKELQEATDRWRRSLDTGAAEVRVEHVAQIVSKLTGVPVSELTTEERQRLTQLEEALHKRVIGQDEAVKAVSDAVRLARAGLREGRGPIANFLFLGPTGVGKTELAKALAEQIFGSDDSIVRLDMSEYMERHAVARLIGAPPGYVGYEEGGQLTERVRRRPFSVILLDEIEKAHPDVHNILLQVFDDGRLTDGKGRVVDFTNTIIIATSNIGADIIARRLRQDQGDITDPAKTREELMETLRMHFRPEFINRIDEIIVFHSLTREQIRQIVQLHLERVVRTAHAQGIELEVDQSLVEYLAEAGYRPEYGARELKRLIRTTLETELARAMLADELHEGDRVKARWDESKHRLMLERQEAAPAAAGERRTRRQAQQQQPSSARRANGGAAGEAPQPQVGV